MLQPLGHISKPVGGGGASRRPPGPGRHPARAGPAEEPLSAPTVLLGGCRLRRSQAGVLGEEAHALGPGDRAPFRTELGLPGPAPVLGRGAHLRRAGAGDLSGAAIQQGNEVLPETAETWSHVAMTGLMLRRLARIQSSSTPSESAGDPAPAMAPDAVHPSLVALAVSPVDDAVLPLPPTAPQTATSTTLAGVGPQNSQ